MSLNQLVNTCKININLHAKMLCKSPKFENIQDIAVFTIKFKQTRIDVYETLCPQQMLVHKGGKIKNWGGVCRDVTPTKLQSQNIFKESTMGGGGGGCERRIKFFVKIQKTFFFLWGGGGGWGWSSWVGSGWM